jgi:hypothetical protein
MLDIIWGISSGKSLTSMETSFKIFVDIWQCYWESPINLRIYYHISLLYTKKWTVVDLRNTWPSRRFRIRWHGWQLIRLSHHGPSPVLLHLATTGGRCWEVHATTKDDDGVRTFSTHTRSTDYGGVLIGEKDLLLNACFLEEHFSFGLLPSSSFNSLPPTPCQLTAWIQLDLDVCGLASQWPKHAGNDRMLFSPLGACEFGTTNISRIANWDAPNWLTALRALAHNVRAQQPLQRIQV